MKGEGKELTDFALMFTAGAAAGLYICSGNRPAYPAACISFFASVALALYSAMTFKRTGNPDSRNTAMPCRPFLVAAFFFSGIYCASIASLNAGCRAPDGGQWFLRDAAQASLLHLKTAIESIPFRDRDSNALILALITGDRSGLPPQVSSSFRISGASHILALSGMHLGVVYIILTRMFAVLGNSPSAVRIRSAMTVAAAGFYTMMTGAGASILRAFLFITLNETARCTGRKRLPMNIFSAALMTQAALSPHVLESVSFQLSYLAMAGLYLLYPVMRGWYRETAPARTGGTVSMWIARARPMKRIWDMAAMSISCQIFTAPAAWYYFGTFPPYFLITNLIAVPLSTAAINLSIPLLILQPLGLCPGILVEADNAVIQAMCRSLEIISGL